MEFTDDVHSIHLDGAIFYYITPAILLESTLSQPIEPSIEWSYGNNKWL